MEKTIRTRRRVVVDESALAAAIGGRIKRRRAAAGLTQAALAGDRYTKAYISALEHGLAKPSMAALNYLAPRLGTTASALIADQDPAWERIEADLAMASGDWLGALDAYGAMLDTTTHLGGRADLQIAVAECLCRLNRAHEAIRPATEAVEAYGSLGRHADVPLAEYWLASAQFQSDNLDAARGIVTGLIARLAAGLQVSDDFHVRLLVSAAMIEAAAGESGRAIAYLEEARGRAADLDMRRRAVLLKTLATAYREAGDLEGAIRRGQEAITLLRVADADSVVQDLENDLAMAYLANGNIGRANELAGEARGRAFGRGDLHLAAHLTETQASIALAAGDAVGAIALADEAIDLSGRSTNDKAHVAALITRARANAARGQHAAAAVDFEAAAERATEFPARRRDVLSAWADSLAALGQHDRAFALAREALDRR